MRSSKVFSAFLLLFVFSLFSFDLQQLQDDFFTFLKSKLATYNKQVPDEKVYLHLDKPFYKPGEDIWFQAYVVGGSENKPSDLSSVLYVELINPKGNVERTLSLALMEGKSNGEFHVDHYAPGGLYKVRAYTQWMKNFGEESFFGKDIQVQKVVKPKLLLKLDFEKEAYGPADKVVATLKAKDLENEPIRKQKVNFSVSLAGKNYRQASAETDEKGEAKVTFILPEQLTTNDGLLNIIVSHRGVSESISRSIPIVLNQIDLQFFPEGGDLVSNVKSKVAIKASNEFGKAADIEGVVLNSKGKAVASFKSYHMGMGAFEFTPKDGESYVAKIKKPVALEKEYPLPKAMANGYTLSIEHVDEKNLTATVYSPVIKSLYLVGQVRGEIYFKKEITPKIGLNTIDIPLKDFPIGVVQFTLFDHYQVERCERLVFVNQHKKLHVEIESNKEFYQPREKVELTIRTYDEDKLPLPASLSVAVVDDQIISFADDKQDNILSYVLLSSELKGKIEEPDFYFKEDEPKATQALDYLLMTQGWRRFSWKEVLKKDHAISFYPEKLGSVSGRVINLKTREPIKNASVTLIELSNKRRAAQLKTKPDGSFLFLKVDPKAPVQLFAHAGLVKKENIHIELDKAVDPYYKALAQTRNGEPIIIEVADEQEIYYDLDLDVTESVNIEEIVFSEEPMEETGPSIVLQEDSKQLEEVVIVGYSSESRASNITGSVVSIRAEDIPVSSNQSFEQALQGKAAGVSITQNSGALTESASVSIRGSSSLVNNNPLFVIDGFPIQSNNGNISALSFISPNDIESVSVLKSPEASALFGSRASNGAILINTKSGDYDAFRNIHRDYSNGAYASLYIQPKTFTPVREFYAPNYASEEKVEKRTDFRETIYWNADVVTDRKGEARISFYNSDATTAFRVTAEGIGTNGYVGRKEYVYSTILPISLEAKIPAYLTFEDTVSIPILIKNNTNKPMTGMVKVQTPENIKPLAAWNPEVEIAPKSTKTYFYDAVVLNRTGTFTLRLQFENNEYQDFVEQEIEVSPKGFPVQVSFSGQDLRKAFSFQVNSMVNGSLKAGFVAYQDVVGDLMAGIESILREPHGCFEQVSSSTYPNVLALQFLKETGLVNPAIEQKALGYITNGYKKLAAYETSENGFEWYGNTPPHEGLTAYGLLEFTEMQKVYPGVDQALLRRTKNWLLNRRDGEGGFKQNHGKYGFAAASTEVNNAYIVYALSECGLSNEINKEYKKAYEEAVKSKDAYRMALLANAAYTQKKQEDARVLMQLLAKQLKSRGLGKMEADHSLVRSYGESLQIEVASLIGLAILKEKPVNEEWLRDIVNYLISSRRYGQFGSTQGTIQALTLLTAYAQYSRRAQGDGLISLYLNGNKIANTAYTKEQKGDILLASLEQHMKSGKQGFEIVFDDTQTALPYSFNASWTSYTPNTSKDCMVDVDTKLAASHVRVNETVRLTAKLTNKSNKGVPQTLAVIGIPSGLSVQPWQLKEYQEKKLFDFYEVYGNYVVFYYREMGPKDQRTIHLDLKAEVPGTYQACASSAYLYYTNEHKDWEAGETIKIMKD